ncbi:prostaglandin-H2 D-isomerase-like isoform X1 [Rhinatrema bivittatum]|uniref:prostaglandin-H2 D-isomerase-like isoform X1 n=2 Tax=Rhinatrema bivittatum TaxID=194408 RepID=UPI00112781FB|nr:prostaglandin-H2 D-isomerase-like isoform X1 [Rhinatrema bivittatum]XP_029469327.1 prostaglandin-H2 D-isomerase-like isoform X1 [Rhinatrema bivittatum]
MRPMLVLSAGLLMSCMLQAQADHHVQEGFVAGKFVGKWYGLAMAADNPRFMKMKNMMTMPIFTFRLNVDSSLDVAVAFSTPQGCRTKQNVYRNGDEPGHFTFRDNENKNGKSNISVVETDYNIYALVISHYTRENGQTFKSVTLFGRAPVMTLDLKKKFEAVSMANNFSAKNFSFLAKNEVCEPV